MRLLFVLTVAPPFQRLPTHDPSSASALSDNSSTSFRLSPPRSSPIVDQAISFLSLCVCQVNRAYHHVEFLQNRLGPAGRRASRIEFELICLFMTGSLTWQLGRLAWNSWLSEDVAPTEMMTPLWLPQALMPLGMAALCVSLLRTLWADIRAGR